LVGWLAGWAGWVGWLLGSPSDTILPILFRKHIFVIPYHLTIHHLLKGLHM
jgi:hypothetical protein